MRPSRRTILLAVPTAVAGAIGGAWWARGSGDAAAPAPIPSEGGGPAGPTGGVTTPTGAGAAVVPDGPAAVTRTTFHSAARGQVVSMVVVSPVVGSVDGLPLCLVLHGRGDDAPRAVTLLGLDTALADAARTGTAPPFVAVTVDGSEAYWHPRASGDDPERMILTEILPRLADQGLRTTRFAAIGWSMGGYGALLLAQRHPDLVTAVAASSPALWRAYGASAPGAFDSATDFAAHQVLGEPPAPGVTYRIDCGQSDPFYAVSRQAASELAATEQGFGPGGHDPVYWRAALPAQLAFVGRALAPTAPPPRPTAG
ncbi:alpha/beta hydrolase [Frankia nepalensis]|uniref:Acyl-CoA:diacylglycerol acyltransferase n=1 Tax=Frankia nepalensis TaxID=1836974 RepID=A0A937RTW1_9ACTN|nr:alpha/beta fold hydrolase [Frankia nepalensis]MBL7498666.1 esterase [Frankia nepalensis]MBL7509168.1 esterase [Frankia nepalensis]MBL7633249.1 esterase [Frankia nepalensis]